MKTLVELPVGVRIAEANSAGSPIAVIGCLENTRGLAILDELISWTCDKYHVYVVYQAYPGRMFEYPALRFSKDMADMNDSAILYLHTKGAFNSGGASDKVRRIWKREFHDGFDRYQALMKDHDVLCPFCSNSGITWYNGFMANRHAWDSIDLKLSSNRWIYETLFAGRGLRTMGVIRDGLNDCMEMGRYLEKI